MIKRETKNLYTCILSVQDLIIKLFLKWSEHDEGLRRRANPRNVSFRISLRWSIHIINPDDKPNYLVMLPTDAASQFL